MSLRGKWRITEMPDYEDDFPDMMEPAYILFDRGDGGEFAFGCVTGQLHNRPANDRASFTWQGNDEMDEASGDGWAELQPNGSLNGEIGRVPSRGVAAGVEVTALSGGAGMVSLPGWTG